MISDHEENSDDSDAGGGGWGLGAKSSMSTKKLSANQQRERFQATRNVPSLNVETVDHDPMASISSFKAPRSRSPSPSLLDRDSSESTNSLDEFVTVKRSPSQSLDTEFVTVQRPHTKSITSTLSNWRSLDGSGNLDDGDFEEIPQVENSLTRSDNFERSQLYLLVARCISYPFTARYQLENSPPKQKLNEEKLGQIVRTLRSVCAGEKVRNHDSIFLAGEMKLCKDEGYMECVRWFVEVVLQRSDVVSICKQGSFSAKELVSIFKVRATKHLMYASPTQTPNPDDVQLWVNTFRKLIERVSRAFPSIHSPSHHFYDSSTDAGAPNPDKLYKLFQQVLKIRNVEHQILYKECMLGNGEEQEAVVRREIQNRKKHLEAGPSTTGESTFGSKKVEAIFREEQLKNLKILNNNLDQLTIAGPPTHSQGAQKKKRGNLLTETGNFTVAKQDVQFKLKVTVTIHELTGIPPNENRPLFCAFELEGNSDQNLRTNEFQSSGGTIRFVQAGDFWTSSPVPQIKLTLLAVTKGLMGSSTKTLVKKTHVATPSSTDVYTTLDMIKSDRSLESLGKLKISTVVERPNVMKKSGFLMANGEYLFKEMKKRFFALIQLSQYKFILTVYSAGASYPKYTLLLDQRFSVEFPTPEDEVLPDPSAKGKEGSMFILVSEESEVGRIRFGCRDDTERDSWMKWLARATGQNLPTQADPGLRRESNDLGRYGLQAVVDSVKDITAVDPHKMFAQLFKATLDYRLTEETFSRGLFSPPQMYVLDEFCARYGVRDIFRHLTCLHNWLLKEETGVSIWPVMVLSSFRFCQMHIGGGNPIEKSIIVTVDERENFAKTCKQLEGVFAKKIQNFHSSFPYGLPKDDLKITLKLYELVVTANQVTGQGEQMPPVKMLTTIMEKAALVNYKKIYAGLKVCNDSVPLTMDQLSDLALLCIEFMYELHDYYWEDFTQFTQVFSSHLDCFWLFFHVDAREALASSDLMIDKLKLFYVVNKYFCSQPTLRLANFHRTFLKDFSPIVTKYIDSLDQQLKEDLVHSLAVEKWEPVGDSCKAMEGMVQALQSFKSFISELGWPEKSFASQLELRVTAICAQRFHEAASEVEKEMGVAIKSANVNLQYHISVKLMVMINTVVYLKSQALELCLAHSLQSPSSSSLESAEDFPSTEEATPSSINDYLSDLFQQSVSMVIHALCQPMEFVLSKISKHDPSDGFLAALKNMLPKPIPLDLFDQFLSNNISLLIRHINPSIRTAFILNWHECQLQLVKQWLDERPNFSLQNIQHQSIMKLMEILQQMCSDMPDHQLESDTYTAVQDRIKMETSYNEMKAVGEH